ncbi:MAG: TraB/GumN family protein [Myxococcales bacterium]|nr:TraB/GumN family protein [Myxococcales bacterium]MDH5307327.1 TraB/GumN family protein [Myxococcales bacterium]MDH5566056.1 TraB/GumN family protein [Myxococcales bacterium]
MSAPDSERSSAAPPSSARRYPPDVHVIDVAGREFILVGTAHVSRESAALVREVIEQERPDCVCIELDAQRYEALSQRRRWENLDLRQIIRNKQLAPLLANLLLSSYQKKLGGALGVLPGAELLEAARTAEANGIPVALCDRDVRVTLRRVWASMSFWKKGMLLSTLTLAIFDRPELDEDELRRLRDQDVLSELMLELGEALPALKHTLIDERDAFLAQKILETHGERVVAVVGAGHVNGIRRALTEHRKIDLDAINTIPPISPLWKWIAWGVPSLILGSLAYIAVVKGLAVASQNLLYWIVANGIPTTLGAALALAHPIVVVSAFAVAPVTSLIPVIGAGYVLAFLQAYLTPPVVREFERLADDAGSLRQWWRNRLLRILLVFVLTTIGSLIGTYVGGYEIVSNVF